MKRIWWVVVLILVLGAAGVYYLRAQAARQSAAAAAIQTATVERGTLAASIYSAGTVRSGDSAVITWQASGKVGSLNVNLGDVVDADQELAVLDPNSLPPSMINARQTLNNARKDLDDLLNSKLQQAQALQTLVDAQNALADLKVTAAGDSGQAQVNLATAQKALDDAQRKRNAMNYPHSSNQLVIEKAETDYMLAKAAYKEALQKYNLVAHKKLTTPERVVALNNLVTAEQKMDQAFAKYNWYLLNYTANDIAQADANLALAKANLEKAQAQWDLLKDGANSAALAMAEANLADAERAWARVKDGPSPDDVAAAQAAVDAAQATLNQAHLLAPFGGTVTQLDFRAGSLVDSGQNSIRIDDLSSIYIDLQVSEVDIAKIQVGQTASLSFDAIPGQNYSGKVTQIGIIGASSQGVVNYPVTVQITNPDANVRPGLTAAVSIIIAQKDNVLLVPNQAIRVSNGRRSVMVLFEGQQIPVQVTIGLTNESMSEITGNQLKEGDTVIITSAATGAPGNNGPRGFFGGFGG